MSRMTTSEICEALDLMEIRWTCNGFNIWLEPGRLLGAVETLEAMGFRWAAKRGAWYARA